MKRINWQVVLCACLLALSAVFYSIHYLIFKDAHHIFIYMFGDIAFVFTEVLLVTVIIHRVLEARERKARLVKLNMVIGAFFSEAGDMQATLQARNDEQDVAEDSVLFDGAHNT